MASVPQTSRVQTVEEHELSLRNSDQPSALEDIVTIVGAQPSPPDPSVARTALTNAAANNIDEAPEPNNLNIERRNTQNSATSNAQTRSNDAGISEIPSRRSTPRASLCSTSDATRSEASERGHQALPTDEQNNGPTLRPVAVPHGYDEINFKPAMLGTRTLCSIILFDVGCLVGLLLVVYKADSHNQYHTAYGNMHLVVRYVPTTVGTLTLVIFRSMRDTFARIQPYISMSNHPNDLGSPGTKTIGAFYLPRLFWGRDKKKRLLHHRHQDWLRWAMFWGGIMVAQITGYKAALFSASSTSSGTWIITVHNSMAFVIISLYSVVIVLTVMTLIRMTTNKTGLRWDPITIADQLALFHGSNILGVFRALEQYHNEKAFDLLAEHSFRLGYWKRPNDTIWYGIGAVEPSSMMVERDVENAVDAQRRNTECQRGNNSHATFCSCNNEQRCTIYPWTKNSIFAPWTILAWGALLSASVVICVYTAASKRVQKGFTIHNTWWEPFQLFNSTSNNSSNTNTPSQTNDTSQPGDLLLHLATLNFSPANDLILYVFAFRSVLVIFASYFTVAWFSTVDQSTRFSQPFANMYKEKEKGATTTESILLDYLWGLPGLVTYDAFSNSHYKVAWFSLLDLASPIFPILVGGIFTITNTGELIVFTIVPVTFYFVLAYLAVYLVTMFFVFPGRGRRLLRFHFSIADYASLFYASHLLNDTDLEHPEKDTLDISGKNVTSRHLYSRIFLEEKKYKMGFYVGTDKQWHWGLERADLGDVEFVTWREFQQQEGRLP